MTTTPSPDQRARFEAQCTLEDCPTGLFIFDGCLCFKSEYGDNNGNIHAYVVSSGEAFWGGTSDVRVKRRLVVTPITNEWADSLIAQPAAESQKPSETADPTSLLTSSERLHEAVSVMLKDWHDGDFALPRLAEIHMANVTEKYLEVGRALKFGEESFVRFQAALAPYVTAPSSPAPTSGKVGGTPLTDAVGKSVEGKTWQVSFEAMHDHAEKLERDLTAAREEVERYSSDWQKVVKVALECDPIPACKRDDDQLEPPWEVFARLRSQLATLRAATPAQPVPADEADGEEKRDHMSSLALGEGCAAVQSARAARAQGGKGT